MVDFDLCVITQSVPSRPRSHVEVARAALEGGARLVQLRDKALSTRALWKLGNEMHRLTANYKAILIINDRVDITAAVSADGVHLGLDDMPIPAARKLLGPEAIIGASVANEEEAMLAETQGANYVSIGCIFPTGSKSNAGDPIGVDPIVRIKRSVSLPVLAIGGINCDNIQAVIRAGADGVAVMSAISQAEDMVEATKTLLALIQEARSLI